MESRISNHRSRVRNSVSFEAFNFVAKMNQDASTRVCINILQDLLKLNTSILATEFHFAYPNNDLNADLINFIAEQETAITDEVVSSFINKQVENLLLTPTQLNSTTLIQLLKLSLFFQCTLWIFNIMKDPQESPMLDMIMKLNNPAKIHTQTNQSLRDLFMFHGLFLKSCSRYIIVFNEPSARLFAELSTWLKGVSFAESHRPPDPFDSLLNKLGLSRKDGVIGFKAIVNQIRSAMRTYTHELNKNEVRFPRELVSFGLTSKKASGPRALAAIQQLEKVQGFSAASRSTQRFLLWKKEHNRNFNEHGLEVYVDYRTTRLTK